MHTHFLSIKRLSGKNIILVAAKHNLRELFVENGGVRDGHIDPARVAHNVVVLGAICAADVASKAQKLVDEAGIKSLRKDAVKGLEVIVSLPPNSDVNQQQFFQDSILWAEGYFAAPLISAVIHNDEAAPHCHILILPLIDGRMVGSDLHGGKAKLFAMQGDFHSKVGQRHGLKRQTPQKRLNASIRNAAIQSAFDKLKSHGGLDDAILTALLVPHLTNPEPLMNALGLSIAKGKPKETFVKIMTKPCNPEKPIGFDIRKPIGFQAAIEPEKRANPILCRVPTIGDANLINPQSNTPPIDAAIQDDYVRFGDNDILATHWDYDKGDYFIQPAIVTPKARIVESVNKSIESMFRNRSVS